MIDAVIDVARKAATEILKVYHSDDFHIRVKSDDSPVTEADLVANKTIIEGLGSIAPFPIVTEESPVEFSIRSNWKKYWLVDPLDGTKDFIAKNDGFTVNIALIQNNKPVLGVVLVPATGEVYFAERGKGAFKDGDQISNKSKRAELIGSDSVFHSTPATLDFFEKHHITDVRKFGSSIKICKLAEGIIDVYPRLNGTKEWDTAASHVIANEAGCKLIDVTTGAELIYNKESIKNNHFIACRNDLDFGIE